MAVENEVAQVQVPERHAEALRFIEEMTRNAGAVQEKVLEEILERNGRTEYLRRFGMEGEKGREVFKRKVPVVTYEDLQPEIERIANGDKSAILSSQPVSEFLTSSGTSAGERKLMPTIAEELERRQKLYSLLMPVMNLYVPELDKGKALYFYFIKAETKTPGGLPARPVLTSYYKSDHFRHRPHDPFFDYTSPDEAVLCTDPYQSMYAQMLAGLIHRSSVLRIGAVFASGLLRAFRFLELHWQELAGDIAAGTLSPSITDPAIRSAMKKILKPDADLARFISDECSSNNWKGIVKRIWPETKYLDVIVTGAMAQYIPTLEYYSDGLPMPCTMYASSECYFGLNLKPMAKPSETLYTIMPNMGYFEFIPVGHDSEEAVRTGNLIALADVELGCSYELVITTYSGLNRYRVGDILNVADFYNAAPQFQFVRRKNILLSIDSDKTDEPELQRAVDEAISLLRQEGYHVRLEEYTSYSDTTTIPGHYVIYWELLSENPEHCPGPDVVSRCCLAMEESLNTVYRQGRVADNSIGPLEIRIVRPGTFEEVMDYAISRGASINQYKAPRCITSTPILDLLGSRVVSAHFSPAPPKWTPDRKR